jgi:hypothetical protein
MAAMIVVTVCVAYTVGLFCYLLGRIHGWREARRTLESILPKRDMEEFTRQSDFRFGQGGS